MQKIKHEDYSKAEIENLLFELRESESENKKLEHALWILIGLDMFLVIVLAIVA